MKWVKKICKYLLCVGLAMIIIMVFATLNNLLNNEFAKYIVFSPSRGVVDIPLYFGLGWTFYQGIVNKIHEQGLNYYWMLLKVGLQGGSIILVLLFIMIKLEELHMLWY